MLADLNARLKLVKPCTRCTIADIDPATAATGHDVADTLAQAKAYVDRYVIEHGDDQACENIVKELGIQTGIFTPEQADQFRYHFKAGWAGFPLVGTPQMMIDHLGMLSDAGLDGICLSWLDDASGIRQWNAEVMPLLEKAGLRVPHGQAALKRAA